MWVWLPAKTIKIELKSHLMLLHLHINIMLFLGKTNIVILKRDELYLVIFLCT